MGLSTLNAWLEKIYAIHPREMEMGLERVKLVAKRMDLLLPKCPVITVGGTNGKGSTVAGLEAIYRAAGYQVGAFTSPILFKHNEYVRINGELASDKEFCTAYEKIESARQEISLTPFEFTTLAALWIFKQYPIQVLILEVGLGGRLDAVNIIDPDLSIVTSIGIDHVDLLGPTRESIGREKAGIFRAEKPAICGDLDPPSTLLKVAADLGTRLYQQGQDFFYQDQDKDWSWSHKEITYQHLPKNSLALQNMANVLMGVTLLKEKLPVTGEAIKKGLTNLSLPGRIQILPGPVTKIFDVSHNPHAIAFLIERLHTLKHTGKTYGVFSMLADKDILESLKLIRSEINYWYAAPLKVPRAASLEALKNAFNEAAITATNFYDTIQEAYTAALHDAVTGDRIIIFGSFHTVAEAMKIH